MSDGRGGFAGQTSVLLQVCPNDHPPFGDICLYYAAAARALGWQTITLMLEHRAPTLEPGFHFVEADFAAEAAALLDGHQPVLTLCHRYRAYRTLLVSGAVRTGVVVVAHEFDLLRRRRRRWQRHVDRLRGRAPVVFAGVSDAVTAEIAGITGDAVLLPNGIDLVRADTVRLSRQDALGALGLSRHSFNVGVVGRLHPKKNPTLALEAFAAVSARMPEAVLVFVGDGELADQVRTGADGLPVVMAGFVPDAARHMAAFDLLLVPSGQREAFGMVALEGMAAGVPVLCGPAPGPRFVVGDAGRTFAADSPDSLAEALLTAYGDWRAGSLRELAERARARVETEFSVAAAAGRLEALAVTQ